MKSTIAVYAGSFDPYHLGHHDIYLQAAGVFGSGSVIVAFGLNPAKAGNELQAHLRAQELGARGEGIRTGIYSGFLVDYLKSVADQHPGHEVVLVRGLRNGQDLMMETAQLKFLRDQMPGLKVVFFLCHPEHEHISSTACRQLEAVKPGSSAPYLLPPPNFSK
jgi:pantetheine-phosphate adenylyltransferase